MRPPAELMAQIRAHPNVPEHRVAYADWLEKHGEASRAEFIRAELALHSPHVNPQQRFTLKRRVPQLLKEHAKEWAARLPGTRADRT